MRKSEELANPGSCFNRAGENEFLFTLLGRDIAAPAAIRYWCQKRMDLGKNEYGDQQLEEARRLANAIDREHLGPDWYGPVITDENKAAIIEQIEISYITMPDFCKKAMAHALSAPAGTTLKGALEDMTDDSLSEVYFDLWDNGDLIGSVIAGLPEPEPAPANDENADESSDMANEGGKGEDPIAA